MKDLNDKIKEKIEFNRELSISYVENIINTYLFYEASYFFDGILKRLSAKNAEILMILSNYHQGIIFDDLLELFNYPSEILMKMLQELELNNILLNDNNRWKFRIELFRLWLLKNKHN